MAFIVLGNTYDGTQPKRVWWTAQIAVPDPKDDLKEFIDRVNHDIRRLHEDVEKLKEAVADIKDMLD